MQCFDLILGLFKKYQYFRIWALSYCTDNWCCKSKRALSISVNKNSKKALWNSLIGNNSLMTQKNSGVFYNLSFLYSIKCDFLLAFLLPPFFHSSLPLFFPSVHLFFLFVFNAECNKLLTEEKDLGFWCMGKGDIFPV